MTHACARAWPRKIGPQIHEPHTQCRLRNDLHVRTFQCQSNLRAGISFAVAMHGDVLLLLPVSDAVAVQVGLVCKLLTGPAKQGAGCPYLCSSFDQDLAPLEGATKVWPIACCKVTPSFEPASNLSGPKSRRRHGILLDDLHQTRPKPPVPDAARAPAIGALQKSPNSMSFLTLPGFTLLSISQAVFDRLAVARKT